MVKDESVNCTILFVQVEGGRIREMTSQLVHVKIDTRRDRQRDYSPDD